MKKMFVSFFIVIFAVSIVYAAGYNRAPGYRVNSKDTDRGMQIANNLNKLRKDFVSKHIRQNVKVTEDMAKKTCISVVEKGKKTVVDNNIFLVRFVSQKYRNPANKPKYERYWDELTGLETLDKNRKKKEYWTAAKIKGEKYYMYMKPIFAEKPCLMCHGAVELRPKFIKKKYPEDRSYGFEVGDLMGGVAVYTWKGF